MASGSARYRLQGRVAIVTGGSRGIGREIVVTLAGAGASVVLCYQRQEEAAAEVVELVRSAGVGRALAVKADVSKSEDVKALFDQAEKAFGTVHIVVSNAGLLLSDCPTLGDTTDEEWDTIFNVNTRGAFLVTKQAVNRVETGGGGRIINISSTLTESRLPRYSAYTASKAAVEAFTVFASKGLRGKLITANCVAPGPVRTDMFNDLKDEATVELFKQSTPLERLGETNDIAFVVLFLASHEGEWVNGQVVRANGGSL